MGLGSFISRALPVAIGYATGGPIGAYSALSATEEQKRQEAKVKRETNAFITEQQNRRNNMEFFGGSNQNVALPMARPASIGQSGGFGSSFGSFLGDVGRNILGPIGQIFGSPAVQPFISQQSRGQPALPTLSVSGGQESQQSGTTEAFMGGFGNVLGQAGRFLRSPAGQIGTGIVGGIGASMLGSQPSGTRITRKMKSQFRSVLNLNAGNIDGASDMLGVSSEFFVQVLLKRFRNDGPVVTKAALRKTKTTVRRLKNMCDMYDSLRPTATRRRTPMKRASSTTLIKN